MTFSYTGVAFFLLFLAMTFLSYRIFRYWRQKNDSASKYLFYFCISLLALTLVRSVTGLFFARDVATLSLSLVLVSFIEGVMSAVVAYFLISLKAPKVLPWIGFAIFIFLGLLTAFLTLKSLPYRELVLEESGSLNLNYSLSDVWYAVLRTGLFAFGFIPLIIMFLQQFFTLKEARLKVRAFGLALSLFLGFFIASLDFVILNLLKLGAITRDVIVGILSILIFFVVYLTQKPIPEETNERF